MIGPKNNKIKIVVKTIRHSNVHVDWWIKKDKKSVAQGRTDLDMLVKSIFTEVAKMMIEKKQAETKEEKEKWKEI